MAQSFIDKYVFALMLDSKDFEKGANLATKAANGIKDTLLKTYSIIGGIDLFKNMLTDYTDATRSIDNLNLVTGENITTLQAWKKSIQDVGGNVGAFEGTLRGLSKSLSDLRQFGKVDDRLGILGWQGIDLYKNGRMKQASEILTDIAKKIKTMREADAWSWASAMGIDESTYRLFRLHGENIDELIKKNERWAILKKEDIKTTRQYDKLISDFKNSWLSFSRTIMSSVLPVLQKDLFPEIEKMVLYLTDHKEDITKFFQSLANGAVKAAEGFVKVGEGIGLVAAQLQTDLEDNIEKHGSVVGSAKTALDWGEPLGKLNLPMYFLGKAKDKLAGINASMQASKEREANLQNNVLYIHSLNVASNDPKRFSEGLSELAQTGTLPTNKLDLIPQVGGVNNL